MNPRWICVVVCILILLACGSAHSQENPTNQETGHTPFGSFDVSDVDSVSTMNGNVILHASLFSSPQRGKLKLGFYLVANNKPWSVQWWPQSTVPNGGYFYWANSWRLPAGVAIEHSLDVRLTRTRQIIQYLGQQGPHGTGGGTSPAVEIPGPLSLITPDGGSHQLAGSMNNPLITSTETSDVTGYHVAFTPDNNLGDSDGAIVMDRDGTQYTLTETSQCSAANTAAENISNCNDVFVTTKVTDADGNTISVAPQNVFLGAQVPQKIVDSLGRTVEQLTLSGNTVVCDNPANVSQVNTVNFPAFGGQTAAITLCYTNFSLLTAFNEAGIQEGAAPSTRSLSQPRLLTTAVLPNNTKWSFTYDQYGNLTSIIQPSGATTSYTWQIIQECGVNSNGSPRLSRAIQSKTITGSGVPTAVWNYSFGPMQSDGTYRNVVTDPAGNDTVHVFSQLGQAYCNLYETQTVSYQGSQSLNNPLKTITYGYNLAPVASPPSNEAPSEPLSNLFQTSVTTTLPNGLASVVSRTPDTGANGVLLGNTVNEKTYDYAAGATASNPGPLIRQISTAYAWQSMPTYLSANILDIPTSVTLQDAAGNRCSETDYTYDEANYLTASGLGTANNHSAPPNTVRGNPTTTARWAGALAPSSTICSLQTGASWSTIVTHTNWYDSGEKYQEIDGRGNAKIHSYSSTYWGAYPTQTTNALNQSVTGTYDFGTGLIASVTDANNQTTSYSYDNMGRTTSSNYADGGGESFSYNDLGANGNWISKTRLQTAGNWVATESVWFDTMGRRTGNIELDPEGYIYSGKNYDVLGHVASVTDPYRGGTTPAHGSSISHFDALNRVTTVTQTDGSTVSTDYSQFPIVTATDEAGKKRKTQVDALGHLVKVWEDPAGLNYETDYTYDPLGNMLTVTQKGDNAANARVRSFTYDSLKRVVTATNPESGTICYGIWQNTACVGGYDANSNLVKKTAPAPNQTGSATLTTTYVYDALNRLTQKSYSDGTTPAVFFMYDNPAWGITGNTVGRMTEAWNGTVCCMATAAQVFAYDAMGRVTVNEQVTPFQQGFTVNYTYDLAGDMTSWSPASGLKFSQAFDNLGRATQLTSTFVDAQHPATLATVDSSIGYHPNGALRKLTLGNGLTETSANNIRQQPCRSDLNNTGSALLNCGDSIPTGSVQDFNYNFSPGSADNGNLASETAVGKQNFNRSFGYDSLNRLTSATAPNDNCNGQPWTGASWSYDAWGNRQTQSISGNCYNVQSSFTTNNQVGGYQYDAAGNLLYDGTNRYQYDAENRLIQMTGVNSATYAYDAMGRRVRKSTGGVNTDYVYDLENRAVMEYNNVCAAVCWAVTHAYFNNRLLAEYRGGTTVFIHPDYLGSTRLMTALNGSVYDSMDYLPYGEQISGGNGTNHKFTGKERDQESLLDYFGARYNSASMGGFITADWDEKPGTVPYAHFDDPLSLNKRIYGLDDPLKYVDKDGHDGCTTSTRNPNRHMNITTTTCISSGDGADGGSATVTVTNRTVTTNPTTGDSTVDIVATSATFDSQGNVSNLDQHGSQQVIDASSHSHVVADSEWGWKPEASQALLEVGSDAWSQGQQAAVHATNWTMHGIGESIDKHPTSTIGLGLTIVGGGLAGAGGPTPVTVGGVITGMVGMAVQGSCYYGMPGC